MVELLSATAPPASSGMDAVTAGMTELTTVVGSVFSLMTSNPLLAVFLASSLVGVGIAVFRKVKGAAKH